MPMTKRVSTGSAPSAGPDSYVVIAFSTYPAELVKLDAVVERLRAAGVKRINRSRLIRIALQRLDVDAIVDEMRRNQ